MIAISSRPQFKDQVAKIHGLKDLTDPSLKGKIGISNPALGTASGHIAAMYVLWGEPKSGYSVLVNATTGAIVKQR